MCTCKHIYHLLFCLMPISFPTTHYCLFWSILTLVMGSIRVLPCLPTPFYFNFLLFINICLSKFIRPIVGFYNRRLSRGISLCVTYKLNGRFMFMTYLFVRPNRSQILGHKICELQPDQMTGSTSEVNPPHFPFYRIQTSVLPDKLPTSNYHSIRCIDPIN